MNLGATSILRGSIKLPYYFSSWNEESDDYIKKTSSIMSYLDVHAACKIVLLTPSVESGGGTILNQLDYTHDVNGNAVALDGSQGMVMLRIPQFHYGYNFGGSTHSFKISLLPFTNSEIHPFFYKAGVLQQYRYVAVYPACGYDVSAGAYVDGDGTNAWFDTAADKIGSIAGKKPLSGKTRAQFRAAAGRVGSGWQLLDFWGYAALKLLYITKYGTLNSQSATGKGNTRFSSWNYSSCISATGKVLSINAAGQSTAGGNSGDYSNVFGLEDIYGALPEYVDGWNINNGVNYVCSNPAHYADNTATNYTAYGSTNPTGDGYQNTLQSNVAMLPATVGATGETKVTDYYKYLSGWTIPLMGGNIHAKNAGARLCF